MGGIVLIYWDGDMKRWDTPVLNHRCTQRGRDERGGKGRDEICKFSILAFTRKVG
jgi:hypothetical protein